MLRFPRLSILLGFFLCLFAHGEDSSGSQNTLFFILVSEGEPVRQIAFSSITLEMQKKKEDLNNTSAYQNLNITLRGQYLGKKRKLYLGGREITREADGRFEEKMAVQLDSETIAIPIFAMSNPRSAEEAVLRVSIPKDLSDELESEQNSITFSLGKAGAQWEETSPAIEPKAPPAVAVIETPPPAPAEPAPREPASTAVENITEQTITDVKNRDRLRMLVRATLLSPVDDLVLSPLIGFTARLPLSTKTHGEFRLSGAAGLESTGETSIILEPGIFVGYELSHNWAVSTGVFYQSWIGATTESAFLPSGELTYTFSEFALWRLKHISAAYSRVLNADLHLNQARLALTFEL